MQEEGNKHPALIRHVLPPKHGEIICPEIIKINNALGPAEISSWFSFYGQEEVKFFKGERGRTRSFLHFVTLEDPHGTDGRVAYVQFGSGDLAMRYACQKALPKEASLIHRMNELAQPAEKARRGSSSRFVPFNLLVINAYGPVTSAGMGDHDDKSAKHVSLGPSDPYPQE